MGQLVVESLLSEFTFSHIEFTDSIDSIVLMDNSRCFSLCFRKNNVYEISWGWDRLDLLKVVAAHRFFTFSSFFLFFDKKHMAFSTKKNGDFIFFFSVFVFGSLFSTPFESSVLHNHDLRFKTNMKVLYFHFPFKWCLLYKNWSFWFILRYTKQNSIVEKKIDYLLLIEDKMCCVYWELEKKKKTFWIIFF